MLLTEGETEVPSPGSLGSLYEPLGPSLSFASTHGSRVLEISYMRRASEPELRTQPNVREYVCRINIRTVCCLLSRASTWAPDGTYTSERYLYTVLRSEPPLCPTKCTSVTLKSSFQHRAVNSTNISESVSSPHFTTNEHYTRSNYRFGSSTYSP